MTGATPRRIGRLGTVSRLFVGAVLILLAVLHGSPWGATWYEIVLGLGVFPFVILAFVLTAGQFTSRPFRFTGRAGTVINCAVIIVLLVNPLTAGAAELFYGVTLVIAAWRGQPDCEVTVVSNWVLRRNDQIGCPMFSPIDRIETRHNGSARTP
jgi:hypothetical protein